jgi:hypothetical protein
LRKDHYVKNSSTTRSVAAQPKTAPDRDEPAFIAELVRECEYPREIRRRAVRLKLFAEWLLQVSTTDDKSVLGIVDVILESIEPALEDCVVPSQISKGGGCER